MSFAQQHLLPLQRPPQPRMLQLADGNLSPAGAVEYMCSFPMTLGTHSEYIHSFVTNLSPNVPLILGIEWLRQHDPAVSWSSNSVTFDSSYCLKNCLSSCKPHTEYGLSDHPPAARPIPPPPSDHEALNIKLIGAAPFAAFAKQKDVQVVKVNLRELSKNKTFISSMPSLKQTSRLFSPRQ